MSDTIGQPPRLTDAFNKDNVKKYCLGVFKAVKVAGALSQVGLLTMVSMALLNDEEPTDTITAINGGDFAASNSTFAEEGHLGDVGSMSDHTYAPHLNDALNNAISMIADDVFAQMQQENGQMFENTNWRDADRERYEEALFTAIKRELNGIAALASDVYRTEGKHDVERAVSLNELSTDIITNVYDTEWDCEQQSLVLGLIANKVEQRIFAEYRQDGTSPLFAAYDYQYTIGYLNGRAAEGGGHAFLMSPATGSVIEATAGSEYRAYRPHIDPAFSYDDFLETGSFVGEWGNVYSYLVIPEGDEIAQIRWDAVQNATETLVAYSEAAEALFDEMAQSPDVLLTVDQLAGYNAAMNMELTPDNADEFFGDFVETAAFSHQLTDIEYSANINGQDVSIADLMDISGSTIMRISSIISRHGEGQISTDQAATILANFNTARDNISSATQSPAAQLVDHYYAVSAIGDTEIFRAISIAENSTSSIRHSTVALLEAVAASTADTVQPDSVAKQVRDTPQI